jgi:type I restriction enzyme M protein
MIVKEDRIQSSLWKIFDRLRDKMKNYEVVLYLLILHKEDLLGCLFDGHPDLGPEGTLLDIFSRYPTKERKVLEEGFYEFEREIHLLDRNGLKFIESIFNEILNKIEFEVVFETILFTLIKNRDYEKGEYVLPDELSELLVRLGNIKSDQKVYNPFAGLASFGIKLNENTNYLGEEINTTTHVLGQLRLLAHGKLENSKFDNRDSILSNTDKSYFDRIISSVPFGLKLTKKRYPELKVNTVEEFFIKEAVDRVNEKGKIIAHLSNGFLFRGGIEEKLRESLLDMGLIEGVIQLPSNLMYNTAISSSILILSKRVAVDQPIKMLDASDLYNQVSRTERLLDYEAILSLYNSDSESDVLRSVELEEIKREHHNLTVSRYFISQVTSQFEGTKLKNVLKSAKKTNNIGVQKGKIVSISDLNNNETGVYLDTESIEEREARQSYYTVSEPALLIARVGDGLKPTIIESPSPQFLISNNIYAFSINEKQIDPGYLVFELRKEYVNKQVKKLQIGTTYSIITKKDFLKIEIRLPSLDEQRKSLLEGLHSKTQKTIRSYSQDIVDIQIHQSEHYRFVKHSLKNELGELNIGLKTLHDFLKSNELIDMSAIVSKRRGKDLDTYLEILRKKVFECVNALKLLDSPFRVTERNGFNIFQLIESAKEKNLNDQFEFVDNLSENPLNDGKTLSISINEDHFYEIFNNIIRNALDHGFNNRTDNKVKIKVQQNENSDYIKLLISNNGWPFKEGVDPDFVKEIGQSTKAHSGSNLVGLGGAHISNILELYDGSLNVYCDPENEFSVEYELLIPISRVK